MSQAQAAWHSFAAGMPPRRLTLGSECQIAVSATKHLHNATASLQVQEPPDAGYERKERGIPYPIKTEMTLTVSLNDQRRLPTD